VRVQLLEAIDLHVWPREAKGREERCVIEAPVTNESIVEHARRLAARRPAARRPAARRMGLFVNPVRCLVQYLTRYIVAKALHLERAML
jgi:hypothetical protein